MKIKTSRKAGFTLVEIMIVVAIIGLLAAIAIPNFVKARETAQKNACINNLRQIDGAKQQWALENGKVTSDTPASTDLQGYMGRGATGSFPSSPLAALTLLETLERRRHAVFLVTRYQRANQRLILLNSPGHFGPGFFIKLTICGFSYLRFSFKGLCSSHWYRVC